MKTKLAIVLIIAVLMFTCIPMDGVDSEHKVVKASYSDLFHAVGTAYSTTDVQENVVVYPLGGDESMKRYISDPQNYTPEKGLSRVVEGTTYEVYYIDYPYGFNFDNPEKVMSANPLKNIVVEERSAVKLAINSIKGPYDEYNYFYVYGIKMGETVSYDYGNVGSMVNLNYIEDAYYEIELSYPAQRAPYVIVDMDVVEKVFTGSPYLYIGICIASTALIGLTIFLCGRKPEFD